VVESHATVVKKAVGEYNKVQLVVLVIIIRQVHSD
jgi:hypothetical protein